VEYGYFKRGGGNFRDRDRSDRGGDYRGGGGGGGFRDRGGDFRDNRGGGFRDRGGDFRDNRGGGFRDRGGDHRDRGGDRFEREPEESVFSKRVRAGKRRTYFFDVRKTRGNDFFITITESTRREDGYGYKRHKIFLYKEDFNRFVASLNEVVNHVKTDLMPEFDYEEFDRRQAEWEAQNRDSDHEDGSEDEDRFEEEDDHFAEGDDDKPSLEKKDDDDVAW
jgi:Protein of unknown function (DUF3276)